MTVPVVVVTLTEGDAGGRGEGEGDEDVADDRYFAPIHIQRMTRM